MKKWLIGLLFTTLAIGALVYLTWKPSEVVEVAQTDEEVSFGGVGDSLVAYWKMDEASGDAIDEVGSNDLTSALSRTTGILGNAIQGNGSSEAVSTSVSTGATTNISINAWVSVPDTSEVGSFFHHGDDGGGSNNGIGLCVGNGSSCGSAGNVFTVQLAGVAFINTGGSIGTGAHMLTVTRDTTTFRFYIDGSEVGTSASVPVAATNNTRAGGNDGNYIGSSSWVDEVGIWTKMLSTTEITELYNGGAGLAYPFASAATPADDTSFEILSTIQGFPVLLITPPLRKNRGKIKVI